MGVIFAPALTRVHLTPNCFASRAAKHTHTLASAVTRPGKEEAATLHSDIFLTFGGGKLASFV